MFCQKRTCILIKRYVRFNEKTRAFLMPFENVLSIGLAGGHFYIRNIFHFVLNLIQKPRFLSGEAHPDLSENPFLLMLNFY